MLAEQTNELIDVRLIAIRYLARDTLSFEFSRPDGKPLPTCAAGAHIGVHLNDSLVRQYSLTIAEESPSSYFIGVKRNAQSKGGSHYMHESLKVGTVVKIEQPRNNFPLNESAEHSVLIAGGIGITPIWCMLQRLMLLGKKFTVYYSCRSRGDAAFLNELLKVENANLHFDEETPGKFLDLSAIVASAPKRAHFYCCGPLPMLASFEAATAGLPYEEVHLEYFTAKQASAAEGGYKIELKKSGKSFTIPAGKSILHVLRDAGVSVPSSCDEGVCGTCETRIISGKADHRDAILTEAEREANKTMMICCSGCVGDKLVLDL